MSLCRLLPSPSLLFWEFRPPPSPAGSSRCGLWSHGRPLPSQALLWLDLPPTPPPLCCTHNTGACRFWLWLQLRQWSVRVGALCRQLPTPCPFPRPASLLHLFTPRRLRHWSVAPCFLGRWVGFCPLPPARIRPPPAGIGMLWGIPGFRLSWVFLLLWGSIRPMMTQLPLRSLLESSHPAMTRLPRPLCWGSSLPGTIWPPRPLRGGQIVSGRLDPPRRGRGGQIVPGRLDPQQRGRGSRVMAG